MVPILAQWLPVMVMLLAIMLGVLYNNKRLDDFRDMLRTDIAGSKAELQGQMKELGVNSVKLKRKRRQILPAVSSEFSRRSPI